MKKVVVLGAGRIARPCIQYLLDKKNEVYVVDTNVENIKRCLGENTNGHAIVCNAVENISSIIKETSPDILISLIPAEYMTDVARACIDLRINYVDPVYTTDEMLQLDNFAKKKQCNPYV